MSNYIPLFYMDVITYPYMDVITYPCPNPYTGLINLC